jgi:hypothetical protein
MKNVLIKGSTFIDKIKDSEKEEEYKKIKEISEK